jgi:hypothetical protein
VQGVQHGSAGRDMAWQDDTISTLHDIKQKSIWPLVTPSRSPEKNVQAAFGSLRVAQLYEHPALEFFCNIALQQ